MISIPCFQKCVQKVAILEIASTFIANRTFDEMYKK